jgi:polypyrimidine tract-binding protein 1
MKEALRWTKDFSGSPLHRYRFAGSKNFSHICPPSVVLHVSNLTPNMTEQEVHSIFERFGNIVGVKFFQ